LPPAGAFIALQYVDLDLFKPVNDTLCHDAGDFVLTKIGERLRTLTRIDDMAARLGGDEFAVVLTGLTTNAQAREFADRIAVSARTPVTFNGQEFRVGATIGIVPAPADEVAARIAQELRKPTVAGAAEPAAAVRALKAA
jgi:diguanylate cyclase (GGDEF)-like protein